MFRFCPVMHHALTLQSATLHARPTGALWWPGERLLAVSDLHLGKSERMARRGGSLLPPYETRQTLDALRAEVDLLDPGTVICLGDSFDDLASERALGAADRQALSQMMAGREWVWIEGNHDPGPLSLGGTHLASLRRGDLVFRHIAEAGAQGEISGHFHPKASVHSRGRTVTRRAFLADAHRLILPAFGTYTGGLRARDPALAALMGPDAVAILTGTRAVPVPLATCQV